VNVLIITQYFWPEAFRINDLALDLIKRGHEVTVLTGMPNYPSGRLFNGYGPFSPSKEYFQGINIVRVPLIPRGKGQWWRLVLNYLSFALCASVLGPFRCKGKYDRIFVFQPSPVTVGLPALVLKKIKGSPIIFWVQDLWPESLSATDFTKSKWLLTVVTQLVKFIYKRCECILVQSKGFIPHVIGLGALPDSVLYFPNWAESHYRPVEVEGNADERKELPSGFLVLFAGNIGSAQSFETLLDAAERLKANHDIHWLIFGNGHRKLWLENQIVTRGLNDKVHVMGQRSSEIMPRYFALADALFVSLRKDPIFAKTIPSKVQSYLACGRPIIAALEGAGAEVIEESEAGLVCEPGDGDALASAVLTLSQCSTSTRTLMGKRGRIYYENHFERNLLIQELETVLLTTGLKEA